MEAYVLDKSFQLTGVVDMFMSFIWTERYAALGDFELVLPLESPALEFLTKGSYVFINESDRTMLVDTIEIETDVDSGNTVIVKGPSIEDFLDRRVVWDWFAGNENLQTSLSRLLNENVINPSNTDRKINNFSFVSSTNPEITALTASTKSCYVKSRNSSRHYRGLAWGYTKSARTLTRSLPPRVPYRVVNQPKHRMTSGFTGRTLRAPPSNHRTVRDARYSMRTLRR